MNRGLRLGTFREIVTPPIGHPLTASWYPPAVGITDNLYANGIVLLAPDEPPIVICAIDWSELSNESYAEWQRALAESAGTEFERVVIHCTHAHNTPWPDVGANRLAVANGAQPLMDVVWCRDAIRRVAEALRRGLSDARPIDRIAVGQKEVENIASNRRILGADGKIKATRWTVTRDPVVRAEPEGLIDPYLRSVSFFQGKHAVAVLYFYTTHPTSFDGDGLVTSEFCGLARELRQAEQAGTQFLYLTGCAGNITAGKYNDGDLASRHRFRDILHAAMLAAEAGAKAVDFSNLTWKTQPVFLPPNPKDDAESLLPIIADGTRTQSERANAALRLAYGQRRSTPVLFGRLIFSEEASIISLPAESFVEYQLFAQQLQPEAWIAVAAYADCGPGYIPLARSFEEGGYEITDSFVTVEAESKMYEGMRALL